MTMTNQCCTCGPHPRIDLTAAYSNHRGKSGVSNNDKKSSSSSCRDQIRDACLSHGCFHVAIDLSYDDDDAIISGPYSSPVSDNEKSSLECLAKSREEIEQDIESLFAPSFLHAVIQPSSSVQIPCSRDSTLKELDNWESICNGGLYETPFPSTKLSTSSKHAGISIEENATSTTATFRGRVAESGDEQQSTPEPKLSWEFRRCTMTNKVEMNPPTSNTASSDNETVDIHANSNSRNHSHDSCCSLLPKWTEALHTVASTIIRLLDIPPQLALQEKHCQCSIRQINANQHPNCSCNIDLLRVFRYDAVLSPHNNDHNNTTMGSSAHSDWGTLTVVWQDDKGGLQTFCHACEKWSDVDAATSTSVPSEGRELGESSLSLFVHVGDFLSLATVGDGTCHLPAWPSPRHRVLCPTVRRQNASRSSAEDCRRSLVYFAYPPPGISLDDARRIVAPLASCSSIGSTSDGPAGFYNGYSLLHNQSHQPSSTSEENLDGRQVDKHGTDAKEDAAFQSHQQMRGVSFDQVILDKWNQVQRKAAG